MQFNKERMEDSARHGFTNATDAADYLVNHGVPFQGCTRYCRTDWYFICIEKKIALDDLPSGGVQGRSPRYLKKIFMKPSA